MIFNWIYSFEWSVKIIITLNLEWLKSRNFEKSIGELSRVAVHFFCFENNNNLDLLKQQ